jgi:hypothetical protein
MRERREIPAGTDRATRRDMRRNSVVQQRQQRLDDDAADAGSPARQTGGGEQHHGAHNVGCERRSDPGGVTAHQVVLQFAQPLGGNTNFAERAEPSGYAIADLALGYNRFDHGTGALDALNRLGGQCNMLPRTRHRHNITDC